MQVFSIQLDDNDLAAFTQIIQPHLPVMRLISNVNQQIQRQSQAAAEQVAAAAKAAATPPAAPPVPSAPASESAPASLSTPAAPAPESPATATASA